MVMAERKRAGGGKKPVPDEVKQAQAARVRTVIGRYPTQAAALRAAAARGVEINQGDLTRYSAAKKPLSYAAMKKLSRAYGGDVRWYDDGTGTPPPGVGGEAPVDIGDKAGWRDNFNDPLRIDLENLPNATTGEGRPLDEAAKALIILALERPEAEQIGFQIIKRAASRAAARKGEGAPLPQKRG
jgi:hypothetical protein